MLGTGIVMLFDQPAQPQVTTEIVPDLPLQKAELSYNS
jgi:hypothetical protein